MDNPEATRDSLSASMDSSNWYRVRSPEATRVKSGSRRAESTPGQMIQADYSLFLLLLVILTLGLFMVLDASYARAAQQGLTHGDPYFFFKTQARWAALGMLALLLAMRLPYWKLSQYGAHAIGLAMFLLVLVMMPHLGVHSHGAARWLRMGPIQVQPSEIAKLCSVLYLASYISRRQRSIRRGLRSLLGALLPVVVVAAMIIKQPDLGTALTLVATALVMLAVGGVRMRRLVTISAIGLGVVMMMAMSHSYSRHRLQSFLADGSGDKTYAYQVNQSVLALQAGGLHGLGPGQGDAKFFHLPAPYTDFIATTVGEEFGLVGSLGLVGLFFCYTLLGLHIAHRCQNAYGVLLATGLCTMVTVQATLNLAVITRTVPDTGVPLPMFSFGGSSLVLVLFGTGLLLSISRWPNLANVDALLQSRRRDGRRPDHIPMEPEQQEMAAIL